MLRRFGIRETAGNAKHDIVMIFVVVVVVVVEKVLYLDKTQEITSCRNLINSTG